MDSWIVGFKEFGLAGLLAGFGCALMFFIVKWTLETAQNILKQAADERKVFNAMQIEWIEALNAHTLQANTFHETVREAHKYQREEHIKMMELISKCPAHRFP